VRENLQLGAYGKQARNHRAEQYKTVISLFPRLSERSNQIARTMSGGEQQMVAIGRALMANPEILMLDEPSLGLSPLLCAELFRSLSDIGQTGTGILLVEQNAKLSLSIADRAYLIENGHIVGEGTAEALANDPAVQKAYLGGRAATHRRFMDVHAPRHAQPAKAVASISADDLARRASEIQRAHIEARRAGEQGVPGSAFAQAEDSDRQDAWSSATSIHANKVSLAAGDLARRASNVLADHVAKRRPAPAPEPKALPPPPAENKDNLYVLSGTSVNKTPTGT
jgi:branched-chain amino acid transport system ATP-binding protein